MSYLQNALLELKRTAPQSKEGLAERILPAKSRQISATGQPHSWPNEQLYSVLVEAGSGDSLRPDRLAALPEALERCLQGRLGFLPDVSGQLVNDISSNREYAEALDQLVVSIFCSGLDAHHSLITWAIDFYPEDALLDRVAEMDLELSLIHI